MRGQKRVEDARERAYARASIFFVGTFFEVDGLPGQSPAMTTLTSGTSTAEPVRAGYQLARVSSGPHAAGTCACARDTSFEWRAECCIGTARMSRILELVLNGRRRVDAVPDNLLLLDYLREVVGLTGTKTGCDGGECGACTVLVDDKPKLSCLTLAATVNGQRVDTVESLGQDGRLSAVQRGFHEKLGSQCGYCTPGFIMASAG